MYVSDTDIDAVSLRQIRRETVTRRAERERAQRVRRGLLVALAVVSTFMVAVAVGVAAST